MYEVIEIIGSYEVVKITLTDNNNVYNVKCKHDNVLNIPATSQTGAFEIAECLDKFAV